VENVKILKRYKQEVVYDKRKEHANGNSLSEHDWYSGKKDAWSSYLESVIESIIEREETF